MAAAFEQHRIGAHVNPIARHLAAQTTRRRIGIFNPYRRPVFIAQIPARRAQHVAPRGSIALHFFRFPSIRIRPHTYPLAPRLFAGGALWRLFRIQLVPEPIPKANADLGKLVVSGTKLA
jgi:hypothetical protein